MKDNTMAKAQDAINTLDALADCYGIARASKIAILANQIIEISKDISAMQKELMELRKFKEEHTEHDNQRNEVPAES